MSPPTMESDQKTKPKFKASLTTQKLQSPTKHKQQEAQAFSSALLQDNDLLNEALLALDGVNNSNNGGDDDNNNSSNFTINKQRYFESLPPGYKFKPSDEELIVHYLMNKVDNKTLPLHKIKDVNLYKHNPSQLAEIFPTLAEKEWYFFTPRDRKYRNGNRPNRAAGDGYWKATGADKIVEHKGDIVGYRKALVFYKGRPPKGDKTKWIMHEFRVKAEAPKSKKGTDDMRLDDWVLCRIYQKANQARVKRNHDESGEIEDPKTSAPTPPSVPSSPFVVNPTNPNAVVEMNYNYNPVGGSNGFMGNPLVNNNYPQMAYQNGGLVQAETQQQYLDASLVPNYARFNSHHLQQQMNFNYGPAAVPISSFKPPPPPPPPPPPTTTTVHHTDNIAMPMPGHHYIKGGDMAWDPKPRHEEEIWKPVYDNYDDFAQLEYLGNLEGFGNNLSDNASYNPPADYPTDHPNLPEDGSYNNPPTDPSSF
ncbi:NAC domain-containing protein 30-like [Cornus florida]|uniref:NAC domain-containing protein 30-like n=1 Tax=Cornus florida TaxID=4283 RepID=UPI0028A05ECA|nr:NAC domain-containing protein 30-like [Cornus florida]